MNAEGRRAAAAWVERCIDGRVLEAVRERGQQVGDLSFELLGVSNIVETRSTAWWELAVSTLPCSSEAWPYLGVDIPRLGGFSLFYLYLLK